MHRWIWAFCSNIDKCWSILPTCTFSHINCTICAFLSVYVVHKRSTNTEPALLYQVCAKMSKLSAKKCSVRLLPTTLTSKRLVEYDVKNDVNTSNRPPDVMHESRLTAPCIRRHLLALVSQWNKSGGYLVIIKGWFYLLLGISPSNICCWYSLESPRASPRRF